MKLLLALVALVGALQVIDAAPAPAETEVEEFVRRGLLDNVPVFGSFLEGLTDVPLLGPIAGDILRALNIMKKREEEVLERQKRDGILSNIPVAGTLLESLGEIPLAGPLFDSIFHGLRIIKREAPEENPERVERDGILSNIPVAGTLLESLGEIPLAGPLFDSIFHGLRIIKREAPEENAERVKRDGILSNIPVAGTLLESLGEIPLAGPLFDSIFHGLRIIKREVTEENAERVERDGILSNIPVAGTLIESLGEIPLAGPILDSIFHGLRIVREMEIPEGATVEETHHLVKRQLCAEIPIIRKWCHGVAEIPLIGGPIKAIAEALGIMKK